MATPFFRSSASEDEYSVVSGSMHGYSERVSDVGRECSIWYSSLPCQLPLIYQGGQTAISLKGYQELVARAAHGHTEHGSWKSPLLKCALSFHARVAMRTCQPSPQRRQRHLSITERTFSVAPVGSYGLWTLSAQHTSGCMFDRCKL
jgi:hypothetical protein